MLCEVSPQRCHHQGLCKLPDFEHIVNFVAGKKMYADVFRFFKTWFAKFCNSMREEADTYIVHGTGIGPYNHKFGPLSPAETGLLKEFTLCGLKR